MRHQTNKLHPIIGALYQVIKRLAIVIFILGFITEVIAQDRGTKIELFFSDTDSVKLITAIVQEQHPQYMGAPVSGIDLYFYVQRSFSLLPIGSVFNTTDELGKVEVEFPSDLPGDTDGNVILLVKIEDTPPYRDTTIQKTLSWGIPLVIDEQQNKRSLWAARANAPMSLILLVNSILLVVWGIIGYILFQLYMIYKEESASVKKTGRDKSSDNK
ncbi:hypothetical protein [Marinifilum sp. D714]|uniref:hypothetical protein n=1 Tax=Marinifilum sp. D714 TaxID=2937523 RepID=UPI0027C39E48|nr:hypothetical protein [Marinifilum sp. D714]MDQ2177278.1 hypothetical protein [Marinifilum sp. D714]